jgi:nitronate monooxygenase
MLPSFLERPIVLAPLAGGPGTPALAAAVSEAGGLGFLPAGYLGADVLADRIAELRTLTSRPFGVNLFVPSLEPAAPEVYAAYLARLAAAGVVLGEARWDDDDFDRKLELVRRERPAVVSFTFGHPAPEVMAAIRDAGGTAWVTVTSAAEARVAAAAGAAALVVQGAEAGGHRGGFLDGDAQPAVGLLALLQLVRAATRLPLVAAGGIATGAAVAAVLCAGADAAMVGSAFLRCPEAGTAEAHRRALASDTPTALTRAFTGRLARGVRNAFLDEHSDHAPSAYPEIHHATAPMRAAARAAGDHDAVNLWAGEAYALGGERPAGDVVRALSEDARAALARAGRRLGA